jgi:hypothetical protein
VTAAETFLTSLDATQRQNVLYDFNDNVQRARWKNFPTGVVPRGGINFTQMNAPQKEAAMKPPATVLSPMRNFGQSRAPVPDEYWIHHQCLSIFGHESGRCYFRDEKYASALALRHLAQRDTQVRALRRRRC